MSQSASWSVAVLVYLYLSLTEALPHTPTMATFNLLDMHHATDFARRGRVSRHMNCDLCSLKEVQLEDRVALLLLLLIASGLLVLSQGFCAAARWKHSARALRPVAARRIVL